MSAAPLTETPFDTGGVRLAGFSRGTGATLVFQHGLLGDHHQVAEAVPDLPGLRLLTLDCRGHGTSDAKGPFSIAQFAEDVIALVEARAKGPVVLGGISMGAAIASRIAVRRPDLVRGLVLARPAWVTEAAPENMQPNAEVGALLETLPAGEARARFERSSTAARLRAGAPDNLSSLMGFFARAPQDPTARLLTAISADGPGITEADLAALRVPTLVLSSEDDLIHPVSHAATLAALIPGARHTPLTPKGRDKAAYLRDFHAALAAFLSELPQ